jgi:hypothetical protein
MNHNIIFKPLSEGDCIQLHQWLQEAHVLKFWDDGDRNIDQVKTHYIKKDEVKRYLFFIEGEPAGYFQIYCIEKSNEYSKFILQDRSNVGIDFFIGNKRLLNKGLAISILEKFISSYCQDVAKARELPNLAIKNFSKSKWDIKNE